MKIKKLLSLALLSSIMLTNVIHADPFNSKSLMKKFTCWAEDQEYGGQCLGVETQENLTINGIGKLDGTVIKNQVTVNGVLIAVKSDMGSLLVNGAVSLVDCTLRQGADVNGLLSTKNCTIQGALTLSADVMFLVSSTAESIYIRKNGDQKQLLVLAKGTTVNGTIQFESGKGVIVQKGDVTMNGPVIGAQTILKK